MKYKDFKKTLDKYFKDDEEIYPHAWGSCVTFYKLYHGQSGGLIEADISHGEMISMVFKEEQDKCFRRTNDKRNGG